MFKTLLASVLIVGATLPVSAQVGPGLGYSDYASRVNTTNYGRICTKNSNGRLSMRTGPGQSYGKIVEIPNNRHVPLNFGEYSSDGFWWWNINYNGYNGWTRADYVCEDPQ